MARSHHQLQKAPEDFALAGINYISFFIGGWLFSVIMIGITSKKSEYLRFHAWQCLITHIALTALGIPLWAFYMDDYMSSLMAMQNVRNETELQQAFADMWSNMSGLIGWSMALWGVCVILAIVGMIMAFQGKDFAIPLIGRATMAWVMDRKQRSD